MKKLKSIHFGLWLMAGMGLFSALPASAQDIGEVQNASDTIDVPDIRKVLGIDTVKVDNNRYDVIPDTASIEFELKGDPDSDPSSLPVDTLYDHYKKLKQEQDSIEGEVEEVRFNLQMLARSYGDSIVIRWAPDEYVPWKFLNGKGV